MRHQYVIKSDDIWLLQIVGLRTNQSSLPAGKSQSRTMQGEQTTQIGDGYQSL